MNLGRREVLWLLELALVAALLLLSVFLYSNWAGSAEPGSRLWTDGLAASSPELGAGELMLGVLAFTGVYALLGAMSHPRMGFSIIALLSLAPHIPAIWGHNQLTWQRFVGSEIGDPSQHLMVTAGLFLVSLVGLFFVHRVMVLRRMERVLTGRRIDPDEIFGVILEESVAQFVLVGVGLVASVVLLLLGSALGGQQWLAEKTPWAIVTIGAVATLLLMGFVAFFLRGLAASGSSGSSDT